MKRFRWLALFLSIAFLSSILLANPTSASVASAPRLVRVKARAHRARHHKAHRATRHRAHPAKS